MTNLRNRLDLYLPAEMAIHNAVQEIETMGADVRLTNAQILLQQAKDLVAEFIIEKNIGNNDTRPLNVSGAYICIAYRYGHRDGHSYLVDICGGIDTAKGAAEKEVNERGGKYSVVVFAKRIATGDIEEIYEAKCPEHYTKGIHPFIAKRDHDEQLKKLQDAAKSVLSETMYFEVGEEGEHFEDTETYKNLEYLVNNYNLPNVLSESVLEAQAKTNTNDMSLNDEPSAP